MPRTATGNCLRRSRACGPHSHFTSISATQRFAENHRHLATPQGPVTGRYSVLPSEAELADARGRSGADIGSCWRHHHDQDHLHEGPCQSPRRRHLRATVDRAEDSPTFKADAPVPVPMAIRSYCVVMSVLGVHSTSGCGKQCHRHAQGLCRRHAIALPTLTIASCEIVDPVRQGFARQDPSNARGPADCVRACRACDAHLPLGPRPVVQVGTTARILVVGHALGAGRKDAWQWRVVG